jgi:hypothetical protein
MIDIIGEMVVVVVGNGRSPTYFNFLGTSVAS